MEAAVTPAVQLSGIRKAFDDRIVLNGLDLEIRGGEVLGLVGPNGSGKTTLANILCGDFEPDEGGIWLSGVRRRFRSPSAALKAGIRRLPQAVDIYPTLTVLENIFVGQELKRGPYGLQLMAWARMHATARSLLARVGAEDVEPARSAENLSGGQKQAVGLARLLAVPANILVFDEPTSALGVRQRKVILDTVAAQARGGGCAILISHDVEDVLAVCDRVVGLRNGRAAMASSRAQLNRDWIGRQMSAA